MPHHYNICLNTKLSKENKINVHTTTHITHTHMMILIFKKEQNVRKVFFAKKKYQRRIHTDASHFKKKSLSKKYVSLPLSSHFENIIKIKIQVLMWNVCYVGKQHCQFFLTSSCKIMIQNPQF